MMTVSRFIILYMYNVLTHLIMLIGISELRQSVPALDSFPFVLIPTLDRYMSVCLSVCLSVQYVCHLFC